MDLESWNRTQLGEMARTHELGGLPASEAPVQALATEFERALAALKTLVAGDAGRG